MAAMHLSSGVAALLISAGSLMFGGEVLAQEQAQEQAPTLSEESKPITAVYKAQEVSFQYSSSRQVYACHELENRVANILLAVGARDDINVSARNCDGALIPEDPSMDPMSERDRMGTRTDTWDRGRPYTGSTFNSGSNRGQTAQVRVRLMMPVEVTPEIFAELERDKSRRELVSRVTRNPAAANDPIVFAARRQEVTLSNRTIRLQPEDCSLLEQMHVNVFRKLGVRVLRKNFSCGPRESSSRIAPQLTVETLMPTGALLPMPDPEKMKKSGSAASDDAKAEPAEAAAETPPQ